MLKTIREILRTGNATVKYPFEPVKRPPFARGKPVHDVAGCIACAACAVACPPNAIQMHADIAAGTIMWSIDYGRCVFCGRCEEVCPVGAIWLSDEFELAVMSRYDLEETCTYPLMACSECGTFFASAKEVEYATDILGQDGADEESNRAAVLTAVCPKCKRKADAYRAKRRSEMTEVDA